MINYFILSLVECYEEHMHVLQACRFSIKLWLEYRIIHEVYASHSTDHLWLLTRIVPLVMDACNILGHGIVHQLHVRKGWIPTSSYATILIKSVSLVDTCLTRHWLVQGILRYRSSLVHICCLLIKLLVCSYGISICGAYSPASRWWSFDLHVWTIRLDRVLLIGYYHLIVWFICCNVRHLLVLENGCLVLLVDTWLNHRQILANKFGISFTSRSYLFNLISLF